MKDPLCNVLELLVEQGADLNYMDTHTSRTPLTCAIAAAHTSAVYFLLLLGADPNLEANHAPMTPYCLAAKRRDPEFLVMLMEYGAKADAEIGTLALKLAIRSGATENVVALIQNGAKLEPPELTGTLAAMSILKTNDIGIIQALLDHELIEDMEYTDDKGRNLLHHVLSLLKEECNHGKLWQDLMNEGCDITLQDNEGKTPLMTANYIPLAKVKELSSETLLIRDNSGRTVFHYAASKQMHFVVDLVLERTCGIDYESTLPTTEEYLHRCRSNYINFDVFINLLLLNPESSASLRLRKSGGDIKYPGPLSCSRTHRALMLNVPSILFTLIALGNDVNDVENCQGKAPIHSMRYTGNTWRCLKVLLNSGADLNVVTSDSGQSPLMLLVQANADNIARYSKTECMRWLLEAGADTNIRDRYGRTVVHIAANAPDVNFLRTIFEYNVFPGRCEGEDETASMTPIGLSVYYPQNVEILVKHGYSVNNTGIRGHSPLETAITNNCNRAVNILLENGANTHGMIPLAAQRRFSDRNYEDPNHVISLLLKHRACVNETRNGVSALASSLRMNWYGLTVKLINANCDIKAKCLIPAANEYWTPIETAIYYSPLAIPLLLRAGAHCGNGRLLNSKIKYAYLELQTSSPEIMNQLMTYSNSARPLMEICRLTVRECLGQCPLHSIHQLPIPAFIKDYIALNTVQDAWSQCLCTRCAIKAQNSNTRSGVS